MALVFRGTRPELVGRLRQLAAVLAGREADRLGVADAVLTRGAVALLSQIQGAFVEKARGGVGSDGIKWKPLSPQTIARRRTSPKELKKLGIGGGKGLGTLTDAQRKRWQQVYQKALAGLRARGATDAESRATGIAWGVLKKAGARTRKDVLAARTVEILRDTGALFQSLTPGFEASPARPAGQVFDVRPGAVTVGTVVKPWHQAGVPGRLPARPLWPADGLPDAWAEAVNAAIARGMVAAVERLLRG